MADIHSTPIGFNLCTIGPAKKRPKAIIPVTKANTNIGLAPELPNIFSTHCCGINSDTAVNDMHKNIKIYKGFANALIFCEVLDSILSPSGNFWENTKYP